MRFIKNSFIVYLLLSISGQQHPIYDFDSPAIPQRLAPQSKIASRILAPQAVARTWADIPGWQSKPGALFTFYLSFEGQPGSPGRFEVMPFDLDGDPSNVSDSEIEAAHYILDWVSEAYAPFQVNVVWQPGKRADQVSQREQFVVIGNTSFSVTVGGSCNMGGLYESAVGRLPCYIFPSALGNAARYIGTAAAHELGHSLYLTHQSRYSGTSLVDEYEIGNSEIAPIMGNGYYAKRNVWARGPSNFGATQIQDDIQLIQAKIPYEPDEAVGESAGCTELGALPTSLIKSGLITQVDDEDCFKYTLSETSHLYASLSPQRSAGGTGDFRLILKDRTGGTISIDERQNTPLKTVDQILPPGSYRLIIQSMGNYGDVGSYKIAFTTSNSGAPNMPPPDALPDNSLPRSPQGFHVIRKGPDLEFHWIDDSQNEDRFIIEVSSDGGKTFHAAGEAEANAETVTLPSSGF